MFNPFTAITGLVTSWWTHHGTKIIGFFTAGVTTISYIDEKTVHIIQSSLGDLWAHAILIVSGLVTAYRGFTNTAKTNGPN